MLKTLSLCCFYVQSLVMLNTSKVVCVCVLTPSMTWIADMSGKKRTQMQLNMVFEVKCKNLKLCNDIVRLTKQLKCL